MSNQPNYERRDSSSSTILTTDQLAEKNKSQMEHPEGHGLNADQTQEKPHQPFEHDPEKRSVHDDTTVPAISNPLSNFATAPTTPDDPSSETRTAPSGGAATPSERPTTGRTVTLGTYTRMRARTNRSMEGDNLSRLNSQSYLAARRQEEQLIVDNTPSTVKDRIEGPPIYEPLAQKHPGAMEHPSITFGPPAIILLDLVVPIIIYYSWYNGQKSGWEQQCAPYTNQGQVCPIQRPQWDKDVLGNTIISFGLGELYILLARVYRLFVHRDQCAPLLSRSKWELDATSWVYAVAMICALIPFVVASTEKIPELYLYSPGCLMAFLGGVMFCTLLPIKLPIGINSHVRGTNIRPFCYYAAEDFIAVDGLQDREFRVRFNVRYESSHRFRRMFFLLTLFWMTGICVYLGCVSAVIWTLPFHYAFGTSLGVLFGFILSWAGMTYFYIQWETSREKAMYEKLGHF